VACARRQHPILAGFGVREGLYVLVAMSQSAPRLAFFNADAPSNVNPWSLLAAPTFRVARRVAITVPAYLAALPPRRHMAAVTDTGDVFAAVQEESELTERSLSVPSTLVAVSTPTPGQGFVRAVGLHPSVLSRDGRAAVLLAALANGGILSDTGAGYSFSLVAGFDAAPRDRAHAPGTSSMWPPPARWRAGVVPRSSSPPATATATATRT
jgi:hypothetical protein